MSKVELMWWCIFIFIFFFYYIQLTPQQIGSDYELRVKSILDKKGFITKSISPKQYNYSTQIIEFHGDGGVDLIATYYEMEIYIQCKHFAKKVGPGPIRELNGVKNNKIGCVVSKNGFTDTAIKEADQYKIILVNEINICEKLISYYNDNFLKKNNNNNLLKHEYKIESIDMLSIDNQVQLKNIKNCIIKIYK